MVVGDGCDRVVVGEEGRARLARLVARPDEGDECLLEFGGGRDELVDRIGPNDEDGVVSDEGSVLVLAGGTEMGDCFEDLRISDSSKSEGRTYLDTGVGVKA